MRSMNRRDSGVGEGSLPDAMHWLLLVIILATGLTLRFWHIGECGLSMWDEYSYVRSARWLSKLGREGRPHAPDVAPPLYPIWVAVCFLLAGYHDWVAFCASAVASFLTLPAVYILGARRHGILGGEPLQHHLRATSHHGRHVPAPPGGCDAGAARVDSYRRAPVALVRRHRFRVMRGHQIPRVLCVVCRCSRGPGSPRKRCGRSAGAGGAAPPAGGRGVCGFPAMDRSGRARM